MLFGVADYIGLSYVVPVVAVAAVKKPEHLILFAYRKDLVPFAFCDIVGRVEREDYHNVGLHAKAPG